MRVLFTGASSPLGAAVLRALLPHDEYTEFLCAVHQRKPAIAHPKVKFVPLLLEAVQPPLPEIAAPVDLVIHFAGVTHAREIEKYWQVNFEGTMRLAERVRALGCERFVYVSTRCATKSCGAYGESKLAAERALQNLPWRRLVLLRPAEIYGGGGNEGVDRFISMAATRRIVPWLWGHKRLRLAPLAANDFVPAAAEVIRRDDPGLHVFEICGPENLSASTVAMRIARKFHALPVPLWWPLVAFGVRVLGWLHIHLVMPDQLDRLVGQKTAHQSTPDPALRKVTSRFLAVE